MRAQTRHVHGVVVQRIVDYATQYQSGPLYIPDLAHTIGLSRWHMARVFRAQTGESPSDFIRRIMLERAAHRLHNTSISIKDIGEEACYQNSPSFTRGFVREFGVTPTEYRKDKRRDWHLASPCDVHWTPHPAKAAYSPVDLKSDGPEVEIVGIDPYPFGSFRVHGPFSNIVGQWKALYDNVLKKRNLPSGTLFMTIFNDSPNVEPEKIRTDLCVIRPDGIIEPGFYPRTMPGGTYVRTKDLQCSTPGSMDWCPLLRHWVPSNGTRPKNIPTFEQSTICPAVGEPFPMRMYVGLELDLDR